MKYDYIIIGAGISGTWLSYYLLNEKKSVLVIDDNANNSASKVASGLINPVTGRRVVTTWMADELLPFAWKEYNALGKALDIDCIHQKNILAFPSAPDLLQAFEKRKQQGNGFIYESPLKKEALFAYFNFPFDVMQIAPCYLVDLNKLTETWCQHL
ncbi:MAG TPA: FAD-dependent oxidoreductase, partial [Parafilimonas sp.]|nr:FAD-dependent oxidoreductase [Parafilimonas sp.]